jgi:hypothetical protein
VKACEHRDLLVLDLLKRTFALDDNLWAGLIFALGAAVTLATVAMIIQGHLHWRDRGSADAR